MRWALRKVRPTEVTERPRVYCRLSHLVVFDINGNEVFRNNLTSTMFENDVIDLTLHLKLEQQRD